MPIRYASQYPGRSNRGPITGSLALTADKRKRSRAQAMTEFAIVAPILFFLLLGIFESGLLLFVVGTARWSTARRRCWSGWRSQSPKTSGSRWRGLGSSNGAGATTGGRWRSWRRQGAGCLNSLANSKGGWRDCARRLSGAQLPHLCGTIPPSLQCICQNLAERHRKAQTCIKSLVRSR